ncbi:TonB-dependent receptor [Ectothiorhodospiraceae bacterium 2226]|nr:TonB-dependent receptor [Ectothiorhodospiraceae bacterium 2226]
MTHALIQRGATRGAVLLFALSPLAVSAQSARLLELSIEELSDIPITTVSRRPEPLAGSAAAVFVLNAEDIRRSGATSIPEALRLVPGLQVARINSRTWAISARGFQGQFSNKMLVQIDGRSVYTPVHSGVNWEAVDTVLADIDRIEVIRGPGATQWGANAVNGIINIITKPAAATQGGLAKGIVGTAHDTAVARWGGELGEHGHYRAYGKYRDYDELVDRTGAGRGDDWWQGRAGFRADWGPDARDGFTLQGDVYQTAEDRSQPTRALIPEPLQPQHEVENRGANLLGRWTREQSDDSRYELQTYVDWYEADPLLMREQVLTVDLDFHQTYRLAERHHLVWGLGYRHIRDRFDGSPGIDMVPDRRDVDTYSGFLQDTVRLTDALEWTLGSKLEHNDYTGWEFQPSTRVAWVPNTRHTVWAAVSRAVRIPSRGERDIHAVVQGLGTLRGGGDALRAERLWAYELGYRVAPVPGLFLDATVFHNEYDRIIGDRAFAPEQFEYTNGVEATANGLELALRWQARPDWRLDLAYAYLDLRATAAPDMEPRSAGHGDNYPEQTISLFSRYDLTERVQLDAWLRYVDNVPGHTAPRAVASYTELDLRVGWRPRPLLSIDLVGQNLLNGDHAEFTEANRVERSVYLTAERRF